LIQKYLIIFNPIAGKGAAIKELPRIHDFFSSRELEYEVIFTERPGHALELAREHAGESGTAVIAAGGDGTCNEVINGLLVEKTETDPPRLFGVLPLGRGNDFSYGGHVPSRLEEALEVLAGGNTVLLDAGIVRGGYYPQGRYFGNGVGVGFDTVVGLEAAKMKHVHDALAYVFGALKTLIKFSASPLLRIQYGSQEREINAIQVSLMNGQRMGGVFFMAPKAVNNDGMLDICIVERRSRAKLMKAIMHYTKGTQEGLPGVYMDRAKGFTLKALTGGMVVHADGETICIDGQELEISCLPGVLSILHR